MLHLPENYSHLTASGVTLSNTVAAKRVDLGYNLAGQMTSLDRYASFMPTDFVAGTTFDYDLAGRLTEIKHARADSWVAHAYTYDENYRVTSYANLVPSGYWDDPVTYSYDDTDQLTGADTWNPYFSQAYEYDLAGNRTEVTRRENAETFTVDDGNQVTSDETYSYAYDEEGNLTKRTDSAGNERVFVYDHRNRLISVKTYAGSATSGTLRQELRYEYDTFNRRVSRWADTNGDGASDLEERYIYDGDNVVLDFVDSNGATAGLSLGLKLRYLHGPAVDQILAQEDVGKSTGADDRTLWMLTDNLGSVRDIVDNVGNQVSHIKYDAFGNLIAPDVILTRYLWTGRELDTLTGLQYNRNRWYHPRLGRWISEDPIGFTGGDYNLGRYVGNEVTRLSDPYGLEPKVVAHIVQLFAAGDVKGAMALLQLSGRAGAGAIPAFLSRIYDKLPAGAQKCTQAATRTIEILRAAGQEGVKFQIRSPSGAKNFFLKDGTQFASTGFHEAVYSEGMVYDPLAGPNGMLYKDYIVMFKDLLGQTPQLIFPPGCTPPVN